MVQLETGLCALPDPLKPEVHLLLRILETDQSARARCVQGGRKPQPPTLRPVFALTLQVLAVATDTTSGAVPPH
ncbi:hypothetical protein GH733_004055 [Mirounga leonina]|nr:hypothetical protein GH733_004055 [Mirounga leonina]